MIFDVRGGLGVQITSIIAAYAMSIETDAPITALRINKGSYRKEIEEMYPEVNSDHRYFEKVLEFKNPPKIIEVDGFGKTNAFRFQTARLIGKHINQIRDEIQLKHHDYRMPYETVLHVRYLEDKRVCSLDTFKKLNRKISAASIMFDHYAYANDSDWHRQPFAISPYKDTLLDWMAMSKAKECYGVISAYTISAAMLNPNLIFYGIRKDQCETPEVIPESDWDSFQVWVNYINNIRWNDYDLH